MKKSFETINQIIFDWKKTSVDDVSATLQAFGKLVQEIESFEEEILKELETAKIGYTNVENATHNLAVELRPMSLTYLNARIQTLEAILKGKDKFTFRYEIHHFDEKIKQWAKEGRMVCPICNLLILAGETVSYDKKGQVHHSSCLIHFQNQDKNKEGNKT